MPIYEYRNCISGEVEEHFRHVAQRDDVPAHLTRLPAAPAMRLAGVMAKDDPENGDESARRGLKELEEQLGTKELERQTGFSASEMKDTWYN